ncbi:DegT/DnrJ/EryC1/StrS family aminotransferase [Halobacillus salinus]|uniref:DegT/DnrJ/EryC1/StrS family aminotransferase n=1 Tax=Halobacillus salinus TaxID=192814 RepID=A0A4Z0GV82_9BACI|nr:DegT/DnrJ/EryC1/StrS family aminotransferase [Halobacillus salinus]TGB01137.1 DegT/DnrJ/EryC1/StrS family aminotransferase [Halobacillus salinus]
MIPLVNLKKQFETIEDELLVEMRRVLKSGQYILGPKVEELERRIAEKLGVDFAVAVANGTDALTLTLDAYGIGKGDEVITTPFSFFATSEAITRVGATPVFVDVDPQTFNLSPENIKEKITQATKAILPVHLFGQSADMDEINRIAQENGLVVIEDACQAFGAEYKGEPVGSLGDAACFSFFPTKNLGTMGDGGIVITSDPVIAEKVRTLRVHGSRTKYYHEQIGYNSRLDELHAAILLICLDHIDGWNRKRRLHGERYREELFQLKHIQVPKPSLNVQHVYHLFCIKSDHRKKITEYLDSRNIQTGVYYPCCLHLQEVYKDLGYVKGDFPVAEMLSQTLFAIPLDPFISVDDQDEVIQALRESEEVV